MIKKSLRLLFSVLLLLLIAASSCRTSVTIPPRVIAELNIGESQDVKLTNGETVKLSLLEIKEMRDSIRNAIRTAFVRVSLDGTEIILSSGNYSLPVICKNVQIDCPVIRSYLSNSDDDAWKLARDARFRLWPKNSPYLPENTFLYPIRQEWLASMSQTSNEPTYVDWGEDPARKSVYYHSGHDIGGAEGMDEIISATDGLIVSSKNERIKGYDSIPVYVHPDAVSVIDERGWLLEYVHLDSTDPAMKPGVKIRRGQRVGFIGKQGSSGGWVHLHFSIRTRECPSGEWGIEDAYPYVWESYVRQYKPQIIAVARPHSLVWTGQEAILDGQKSRSLAGKIVSYEWTFTDGTRSDGPVQKRTYSKAGEYSEILRVTDSKGNTDYDFAVVQVIDRSDPGKLIPTIQAAFHPSLNLRPGDPVTFLVRTFNTDSGNEIWNFGDGTPDVSVKSETVNRKASTKGKFAETVHSFSKPGHYVVRVERSNENGFNAITHLHLFISE
jgi:murein DD-endopeptidase MepM/ murein hydrolase activator NlpD